MSDPPRPSADPSPGTRKGTGACEGGIRVGRVGKAILDVIEAELTGAPSGGHQLPLNDDDRYTLRRYADFRAAADGVAEVLARVPAVRRIALFVSVASASRTETHRRRRGDLHQPKDVDLAVWLDHVVNLDGLRKLSAQALNRLWHDKGIGVAHHQIDIFVLDSSGTYLGRLCPFNQCPKHKPECRVEGCGKTPFLRQHEGFDFDTAESLHPARIEVLYERA
jgi:hypothetical protein